MVKNGRWWTLTSHLKKQIIDEIIEREGGYVNDPSDSGGETNWGITAKVARAAGYKGAMKDLPRSLAFDYYCHLYWDSLKLDHVEQRSALLAEELADTAVNMGVGRAGVFLQRALNAFNNGGTDYPDLKVDGNVGMVTIDALNKFLTKRGQQGIIVMLRALNALQGAFYIDLCERRTKDEKFVFGWFLNRVK